MVLVQTVLTQYLVLLHLLVAVAVADGMALQMLVVQVGVQVKLPLLLVGQHRQLVKVMLVVRLQIIITLAAVVVELVQQVNQKQDQI
jgi:hypothetical protein